MRASVIFNAEITAAIADVEATRGVRIAAVDVFGRFDAVARDGLDVRGDGSLVLTTDYLGGLFSLAGVHPTRTGHALVANAFIDAINTRFGAAIPPVDLARVAARHPLVGSRFRPAGEAPFGLFGDGGASVENAFDRLERHADDIAEELADEIADLF